eukprot:14396229-Alexandrium_andersonii.AAC.1
MCIRDRVRKPRQLSPVDSVTLLALEKTNPRNSRSWRVVTGAEGRRAEWVVAVHWKEVPGGELLSFRSWRWLHYD